MTNLIDHRLKQDWEPRFIQVGGWGMKYRETENDGNVCVK